MLNSDCANVNENDDGNVYEDVGERIHESRDLANVLLSGVECIVYIVLNGIYYFLSDRCHVAFYECLVA